MRPSRQFLPALALTAAVATLTTIAWSGQPMIPAPPPPDGRIPAAVVDVAVTQPTTVPTDPYVKDLLAKLNSTDAAQRDAAMKQLTSVAGLMQQPEILKKLQEITTDQELKDFFGSRITQLRALEEEKRLTNLPPITLKLTNASLYQLVPELNKALGMPSAFMTENNGNPGNGRTFSIDAKDKPFWEVIAELQDQQHFEFQNYGDGQPPRLTLNGTQKSPYTDLSGPAMASITNINYDRSVNFQSQPGNRQPANMNLGFTVAVDPRIKAGRVKNPTNVKVVDDEGRTLQTPNNGGGYNGGNSTIIFGMNISMVPPEKLGKTISLTFDTAVATTVGDTKMTVDDIAANGDKPIPLGTTRVLHITNVNLNNGNNANMNINMQPADPNRGWDGSDQTRTPFTISDSTGRVLYSASLSPMGGMGFGFQTAGAKPPYKMEFSVPGRSFEIPLHFEFKDVPLP